MRDRSSVEGFLQTIDANEGQSLLDRPTPTAKSTQKPIAFASGMALMWAGVIVAFVYIGILGASTSTGSEIAARELFMGAYVNDSAKFQGERVHIFASGCSNATVMHFWMPGGQYYGSKPASLTSFCPHFTPCAASKGCDWPLSVSLDLPLNATAGVWKASYDVHGRNSSEAGTERAVSFAVLAISPTQSTVHVIPVYTYAAYNFYGGRSFYLRPRINDKTYQNEDEFLDALTPEAAVYFTGSPGTRTVLSLNRPHLYQQVYPGQKIESASNVNWKTTWGEWVPDMVIPESHLRTHRDWACTHFREIWIHAKNEYVDVGETMALLNCSSNVTLHISSFEYAFHHVNHTGDALTFSWRSWDEGAFRLDRDVFGGSNTFTGHRGVLFCLQHDYGECSYVRAMGPLEGLPDYTLPTGDQRMIVQPTDFEKFGYAPKNSVPRCSFNRTNADAVWKFVGVEFDKDTHKMTNPPVVASFMINTHNGEVDIAAACPGNVCTEGLACTCVGYAPAQSFFDGRPTNTTNFWYFP